MIFKFLKNLFTKTPTSTEKYIPEEHCPNCWGREEYGGKFYEAVKTENIDINSHDAHSGWVKEYADKHLSGIKLIKEDGKTICGKCKISYHEI